MKEILYFALGLLLVTGCAKDDGNYDYSTLNTIMIDSIHETYAVDQYDTLKIEPELSFKLGTLEDLSFEWRVNGVLVSTERNCNAVIEMPPAVNNVGGLTSYNAIFCVMNNENKLKYYKDFKVNVGVPYSNALYVLCERADGTADLAFRRMDKPDAPLVNNVYENANPDYGNLGSKPRQIVYSSMLKSVIVLCQEGDKRMTRLDHIDMSVQGIYDSQSISGGYEGDFNPVYMNINRDGMIVSNGNLFGFNFMMNETVVLAVEGDYELADWTDGNRSMLAYLWCGYDNKHERFLTFRVGDGMGSMFYNNIVPLESETFTTTGQKFLAAGSSGAAYALEDKRPILYNKAENKAYFYSIDIDYSDFDMSTYLPIWDIHYTKIMEKTGLVNESSVCVLASQSLYWYISNGSKVVRLYAEGGETADFFLAPKGDVVCMMPDSKEERMFVATFDGAKGYIYTVSMLTNEKIGEPMEIDGKVASMMARGNWTY